MTNVVIARELEAQTDKVGRWWRRYVEEGIGGGERERPRGWLPRDRYGESVLVRQSGRTEMVTDSTSPWKLLNRDIEALRARRRALL